MNRTVLVRYDEIALKSRPVREKFEKILLRRMKSILKGIDFKIRREHGRIFVETSEEEMVVERLAKLPGIASVSPARRTKASLDNICSLAVVIAGKTFPREGTFAVRTRRIGRHDFSSIKVNEVIGKKLLKTNPALSVDLNDPDQELFVEVREDYAYIFNEIFEGVGGLPVGSQEDTVAIFSGDASSSVAAFLMLKRGSPVYPVVFSLAEEEHIKKRACVTAESLKQVHSELELCTVPLDRPLRKIVEEIPEELAYVVCERLTLRLAEMIAKRKEAKALVTVGLGRNTELPLSNWKAIESAVKIPILHPLVGLEDEDVKKIAKDIGIQETFIEPNPWCSKTFDLPKEEIDLRMVEETERLFSSNTLKSVLKKC